MPVPGPNRETLCSRGLLRGACFIALGLALGLHGVHLAIIGEDGGLRLYAFLLVLLGVGDRWLLDHREGVLVHEWWWALPLKATSFGAHELERLDVVSADARPLRSAGKALLLARERGAQERSRPLTVMKAETGAVLEMARRVGSVMRLPHRIGDGSLVEPLPPEALDAVSPEPASPGLAPSSPDPASPHAAVAAAPVDPAGPDDSLAMGGRRPELTAYLPPPEELGVEAVLEPRRLTLRLPPPRRRHVRAVPYGWWFRMGAAFVFGVLALSPVLDLGGVPGFLGIGTAVIGSAAAVRARRLVEPFGRHRTELIIDPSGVHVSRHTGRQVVDVVLLWEHLEGFAHRSVPLPIEPRPWFVDEEHAPTIPGLVALHVNGEQSILTAGLSRPCLRWLLETLRDLAGELPPARGPEGWGTARERGSRPLQVG